jgi:hypothetical protein
MKNEIVKFETGASCHVVNDLILFADNTADLAAIRDRIYSNAFNDGLNHTPLKLTFEQLFNAAKKQYLKEMPDSPHIRNTTLPDMYEFCQLYADDFSNWIAENEMYKLTHEGKILYKGLENHCYYFLQRYQGHSANHAMRYEGYKITPITPKG